ncbi:MAG: hypothetical protein E6600_10615 [Anaerocolumna aminovalerica]|jgi:hypothetical protein|uniref:hypothetical protein n=1 Tax=Anaerocolumna aminovalerica TaxID=1527 RepID=UPI00290826CE|nr:hypothetical protein [Anaerocolumna aminovalerica]MDU6264941.1 hypothetical protein [Anaerocolumna aminovalerica]
MKRQLINWLGLLGIISLLSYTLAVIFAPLAYPNYNWAAQAGYYSHLCSNSTCCFTINPFSSPYCNWWLL